MQLIYAALGNFTEIFMHGELTSFDCKFLCGKPNLEEVSTPGTKQSQRNHGNQKDQETSSGIAQVTAISQTKPKTCKTQA